MLVKDMKLSENVCLFITADLISFHVWRVVPMPIKALFIACE